MRHLKTARLEQRAIQQARKMDSQYVKQDKIMVREGIIF